MQFGVISEERKAAVSIAGNSRFDIVWIHFFYHSFPTPPFSVTQHITDLVQLPGGWGRVIRTDTFVLISIHTCKIKLAIGPFLRYTGSLIEALRRYGKLRLIVRLILDFVKQLSNLFVNVGCRCNIFNCDLLRINWDSCGRQRRCPSWWRSRP